ncbi:MAG: hypothetical protein BV457_00280 [Thermoplasmata archaeon M9B1D]|nr:MAG: hypothetical protein BV457_00280 [Thermoplasmata archaeon M9B1D]PNX52198.1 MAG: hypothetical protein BV456_00015 [Thermoplasmata archaeon M8B2D]
MEKIVKNIDEIVNFSKGYIEKKFKILYFISFYKDGNGANFIIKEAKELAKYLKLCKKYKHNRLIACVKKDNIPSIILLAKNGFVRVTEIGDNYCYVIDLSWSDTIKEAIKQTKLLENRDLAYQNNTIEDIECFKQRDLTK